MKMAKCFCRAPGEATEENTGLPTASLSRQCSNLTRRSTCRSCYSGTSFRVPGWQTSCFSKCTFAPPATCFDQSRLLLAASWLPQHFSMHAPHSPVETMLTFAQTAKHSLLCVLPSAPHTGCILPEHFLSTKQAAYLSSSYAVVQSHPFCGEASKASLCPIATRSSSMRMSD